MAKKLKEKHIPSSGRVYVSAGFNNTIVTITDGEGNALFAASGGKSGFKGSRKATPYAATKSTEDVAMKAYDSGMKEVSVYVSGPGLGRNAALKALKAVGLKIVSI